MKKLEAHIEIILPRGVPVQARPEGWNRAHLAPSTEGKGSRRKDIKMMSLKKENAILG